MRINLNLQQKILLLVTGSMSLILLASSNLHSVRTRSLIEKDHFENAVSQMSTLANRISTYDYFSNLEDLRQEMQVVAGSRPDFKQIDIYQDSPQGVQLIATTAANAPTLLSLSNSSKNLQNVPQAGASSAEVSRENSEFWVITTPIQNSVHSGFIKALVLKGFHRRLVNSLHRQYNLVLLGAVVASVLLLYLLFVYFFRRPVRDIVQTMISAREGDLSARALERRDDELGEIARGFNQLMDDIAERSREREALLNQIGELNSELLVKVDVAKSELRATNATLIRTQQRLACSERLAAIGQVTASLAHEIGTPLNAMAGHLQLLARNHRNCSDTQRRLNIINSQLASIVQTVRSLLDRTHRMPLEPELTDINAMIRELLLLVEPILESRNIRVSLELDEELPRVSADRESLHQVFLNLVNNSFEAMPKGGQMEIITKYLADEGQVEVRFLDSGVGIPPDAREHLFEPMWTTKPTGSGLGLAIAREIISEHRGEIDCVIGLRQGAELRLTLPAVGPGAQARQIEVKVDAA
ncbi:MAG TPA: ATP-binding protein [Pyrinomonadaceae bacterium]|nr:ATP-binding protein [Pyrinomonadaceae bacterium]